MAAKEATETCREKISNWWKKGIKPASNAGVLRDRYLRVAVKDKDKKHPEERKNLFEAMQQALSSSEPLYEEAYRRHMLALAPPKQEGRFSTQGRIVIGLGGENVLETGLTLHHTYGTPMIPGTALKGLASHYCDQVWGLADPGFKRWKKGESGGEYHKAIFGATDDSGHMIFYDAWITPETLCESLQLDVMTPHHGDYYSDKTGRVAPTDFDDPNPVTFLSVTGSFHVAVSCDVTEKDGELWAKLAFDLLAEALREWGIGGKTNAGYGRLIGAEVGTIAERSNPSVEIDQSSLKPAVAHIKRPKHAKGEILDVTREADPNVRRGNPYFKADDGFAGFVNFGTPPSQKIGEKTKLQIVGVMDEGYVFAVIGSKDEKKGQKKGQKGGKWKK